MLELMDFATGCLTILLCVLLVPLFFLVFKLTLLPRQGTMQPFMPRSEKVEAI